MKKDKQTKNFDVAFQRYLLEQDPALHKKASISNSRACPPLEGIGE